MPAQGGKCRDYRVNGYAEWEMGVWHGGKMGKAGGAEAIGMANNGTSQRRIWGISMWQFVASPPETPGRE